MILAASTIFCRFVSGFPVGGGRGGVYVGGIALRPTYPVSTGPQFIPCHNVQDAATFGEFVNNKLRYNWTGR